MYCVQLNVGPEAISTDFANNKEFKSHPTKFTHLNSSNEAEMLNAVTVAAPSSWYERQGNRVTHSRMATGY